MSNCRNIDSVHSQPKFSEPLTPRQMQSQIEHLHAKIAALELSIKKLGRRVVSKPVIIDMLGCQERRMAARFATRPSWAKFRGAAAAKEFANDSPEGDTAIE